MTKRKSYIELTLSTGRPIYIKRSAILYVAENRNGKGSELGINFQVVRVQESPSEVREMMKGV